MSPFQVGDVVIARGGGERRLVRSVDAIHRTIGTTPWTDLHNHQQAAPIVEEWSKFQRVKA